VNTVAAGSRDRRIRLYPLTAYAATDSALLAPGGAAADQLIIPIHADCKNMAVATPQGFNLGERSTPYSVPITVRFAYMRSSRRVGKMMSGALACRFDGAGADTGAERFIDYSKGSRASGRRAASISETIWRADPSAQRASRLDSNGTRQLCRKFGWRVRHSPWIAERASSLKLGPAHILLLAGFTCTGAEFRSATRRNAWRADRATPD